MLMPLKKHFDMSKNLNKNLVHTSQLLCASKKFHETTSWEHRKLRCTCGILCPIFLKFQCSLETTFKNQEHMLSGAKTSPDWEVQFVGACAPTTGNNILTCQKSSNKNLAHKSQPSMCVWQVSRKTDIFCGVYKKTKKMSREKFF